MNKVFEALWEEKEKAHFFAADEAAAQREHDAEIDALVEKALEHARYVEAVTYEDQREEGAEEGPEEPYEPDTI